MMRGAIVAVLALLGACKGREAAQPAVTPPPAAQAEPPGWVRSRPVNGAYYIGIGLGSKARPDAQETARKNALNELASEISVKVEGNSLLYTADGRSRFDESFTSTIRTTTQEQIEGYELVDTWESPTEYWSYYRLSKAEHARIKAERKATAIAHAVDLFKRARAGADAGDLRSAIDFDLRALIAMKAYWGENDQVDLDGRQVPLVNEVFGHLQALTSGIRFNLLPERCDLNYANGFRREMLISASYGSNGRSRDLPQLPVRITYSGQDGPVTELKNTDADGRVRTTVQRVAVSANGNDLVVRPDMDALVSKELEPVLVKALVGSLTVPEARATIDLRLPRIFMRATETNLGAPVGDAGIAVILREELTRAGFRIVDREADAELLLQLTCSTRSGGEANGFHTAFLDATYAFRDRRTQDVVHEGARQGVKGIQLSMEKAGLDAYKKAGQEVRKEIVPGILGAFQ